MTASLRGGNDRGNRGRGRGSNRGNHGNDRGGFNHHGDRGGRGRGRGGFSAEDRAAVSTARNRTVQISSEGTDDIIVADPAGVDLNVASYMLKKAEIMGQWTQRQIRVFVNSMLLNLSNHHGVDTSGVLRDLASETGLNKLKEILLRPMSIDAGDDRTELSFQYIILPLIGVLTRQKVCQTTMTSESGIIYSTVYFHRREFLENGVLRCMEGLLNRSSLEDRSRTAHIVLREPGLCKVLSLRRALIAIVRLVYQLVKRKRDAQIEMADLVQDLHFLVLRCDALPKNTNEDIFENTNLTLEMDRLQRVVNDAQDTIIHPIDPSHQGTQRRGGANMVHIRMNYDPPGELSENGPRHDNDHVNIADISVLPTQNEIVCTRNPFLPSNDVKDAPHFLPAGWRRLLDVHFRLYREDMMDSLRNGVSSFITILETTDKGYDSSLLKHKELKKQLANNVSLNVYGNVQFEGMNNTKQLAGSILMSFTQPPQALDQSTKQRKEFWERSRRRLMQGSLICIASRAPSMHSFHPNRKPDEKNFRMILGVVTYRDVDALAKDPRRACIHISLSDPMSYLLMLESTRNDSAEEQWFLVESTGSFFESYRPILKALQTCVPATMPFAKYLAPTNEVLPIGTEKTHIDPPLYTRAPGFLFNLSVLLDGKRECYLDVTSQRSIDTAIAMLRTYSTLDNTQSSALIETLSREIALIKGPPGTGKTKIGVDLMSVLLHNKSAMNCGPILCICYTNHALDQFLEHLLDKGVTSIVRVGARSKSERLENYNLTSLMMSRDKPLAVHKAIREANEAWEGVSKKISHLEKGLKGGDLDWEYVQSYLMIHNQDHWFQLCRDPNEDEIKKDEEEGFIQVRREPNQTPYMRWAKCTDLKEMEEFNRRQEEEENRRKEKMVKKNGKKKNIFRLLAEDNDGYFLDSDDEISLSRKIVPTTNRPLPILFQSDVWSMSFTERRRLIESWKPEVLEMMIGAMGQLLKQMEEITTRKNNAYDEIRRDILNKASVIGMTTNGAAKHQTLINAVAPKIIICEEAGEVLEAHILAALSASTQHLILIGDHQQLRPQIESYNLSSDSIPGKQFNLDRSLFERLVASEIIRLPLSHLTIQRRMRPEISSLIRNTLYEDLEDGERVMEYPNVSGMGENLYFMDHSHPEDAKDQYGMQSFSNTFEVKMVEALAHYLIKNGYDKPGDIAVLTPYLGQLSKLRDHLKKSFMLVIDDRDMEQLEENEAEEGIENDNDSSIGVKNISLRNHLTIRTIDNYQGEEAKIVIISLVRSDVRTKEASSSGSIGFLKSPNRTNVLLSRAQHGMYLIGKASLMNQSKHGIWPKVMNELEAHERIGDGFPIVCKKHPEIFRYVDSPEGFKTAAPNGGCTITCGQNMPCGHVCPLFCHPDDEAHVLIKCLQPCPRLLPVCRHPCPKQCGDKCGICMEIVSPMALACGHILEEPRCWERQEPSKIKCKEKVVRKLPFCEHEEEMECHKDYMQIKCNKKCGKALQCGHNCIRECHECQKLSNPLEKSQGNLAIEIKEITRTIHGACMTVCGRAQFCGHGCLFKCHSNESCPPCSRKCEVTCPHSKCSFPCDQPCAACSERCTWRCSHQGECNMPCGAPCDRLPCNERCDKNLACGHRCPSLCGEICPKVKFCVECKDPTAMRAIVDLIMQQSLEEVDINEDPIMVPPCGHPLTMSSLDGLMELNQYYKEHFDTSTCLSTFVEKLPLPSEHVSQICCPMCRKPILNLMRYGRRVKYSQLALRVQKHVQTQSGLMQKARDDSEVALIRVKNGQHTFLESINKAKPDIQDNLLKKSARKMGIASKQDSLPLCKFRNITAYGLSEEQQKEWSKFIEPLDKMYSTYRNICKNALKSPNKQVFEAAVSHLYRIKIDERAALEAAGNYLDDRTTDEIIQACILECGLQADGNSGSSFVESMHEQTNILLAVLEQAFEALGEIGVSSGWYKYTEDLIQCALEHANFALDAAKKGLFLRQAAYARLNRLSLLCYSVQLIGRKSLPAEPVLSAARLRYVKEQELLFAEQIEEISNSPLGILEECLRNADILKNRMERACSVARGFEAMTKEEKLEIFRAVSEHLRGSGHWYQCPNGHPYVIADCGMAMVESTCPECGSTIGGGEHTLNATNRVDNEMEDLYRQR